ncbi:hypothetical protein BOTBODRAFT_169004 [Botryobasidium botryosum FD-172 SS1]|uniref:RING-type domain-containing protein n=1 Tax=Botryobasidium botryosum (strain FD-172 SS1) TaxID=930990 RepID=A0A067N1D6_BOTB1|nr:hypothetical protein BOTBODRAFT_169004 [Botryobasidium botryosum FD-172 SS1]
MHSPLSPPRPSSPPPPPSPPFLAIAVAFLQATNTFPPMNDAHIFSTPPPAARKSRAPANSSRAPFTPLFDTPGLSSSSGSVLSTPYTPFSSRSFASSAFTTPDSKDRIYPAPKLAPSERIKSLADATQNWRMRAEENGIKVSSIEQVPSKDPVVAQGPGLLPAPSFASLDRRDNSQHSPMCLVNRVAESPERRSQRTRFYSRSELQQWSGSLPQEQDPARTNARHEAEHQGVFDGELATQSMCLMPNSSSYLRPLSSSTAAPDALAREQVDAPPQDDTQDPLCAVCRSPPPSNFPSLAVLSPCCHRVCSPCLTASLNIVGEKDLVCMVCQRIVENFSISPLGQRNLDAAVSSLATSARRGIHFKSTDQSEANSTRASEISRHLSRLGSPDHPRVNLTVLRIDNVPWDVTPPMLRSWFDLPCHGIHVLIDRKTGKTSSHAFIESTPESARSALKACRNKVLGSGKRARCVTITIATREELMQSIFPSWAGQFSGSLPTVTNAAAAAGVHSTILTVAELNSLFHLVQTPDSHFLKVPSLPVFALSSILAKFPAEDDSCVAWTLTLRDYLFAVVHATLQTIVARSITSDIEAEAFRSLIQAGVGCEAFTSAQVDKLSSFLSPPRSPSTLDSSSLPESEHNNTDEGENLIRFYSPPPAEASSPFDILAAEFGVEAFTIRALSERLAAIQPL